MKKAKYDLATVLFIGIIIVSVIGAVMPINKGIVWLILGICGAVVAIQNIQIKEEVSFLIATTALILILSAFLLIVEFRYVSYNFSSLFLNLIVGFGVAGFIVALGLISRLGLEK
jgi:hypothetical protein